MLEPRAQRIFERGKARWPGLPLGASHFFALARSHLEVLAALEEMQICAEDLFLVTACRAQLPGAVDAFDAFAWPQLERHLRRLEQMPARLEELRQGLLVKLFVPDAAGEETRVAGYTGRGPLIIWLRMAAARLALNTRRSEMRVSHLGDSLIERVAQRSLDIELSFIRGRYEQDFVAALRASMASLTSDERLLLQFRYRDELTSDQIAVVLKTSRVTAHRRVVTARDALGQSLRKHLSDRLSLSESGLQHLLELLSSKLVPALTAELRDGLL